MSETATADFYMSGFSPRVTTVYDPRVFIATPKPESMRAQALQNSFEAMERLFAIEAKVKEIWLPEELLDHFSKTWETSLRTNLVTAGSSAKGSAISWLLRLNSDATEALKADLRQLLQLEHGWDGQDADQIDPASVAHAVAFIDLLGTRSKQFESFADPHGRVGIESHANGDSIYLLFFDDGLIAYVIKKAGAVHRGNRATPDAVMRILDAIS